MKKVRLGQLMPGHGILELDIKKLVQTRLSIMASSGGGKTYTLLKLLEATRGQMPQCVFDPEGDFTPLRRNRKYNYVLAAPKGGDVLAHPSTAGVLARHWIENDFDLIVDMYDMDIKVQREFARIFCEALLMAPRKFWRPRLLAVDEMQEFAPEKGGDSAESLPALIRVAKKGRKRGLTLASATQRPADVSKALTSQLGNKLIGVAYTDIDQDRAAKELRIRDQAKADTIARLEPGHFYAIGPALGYDLKEVLMDMPADRPDEGGASAIRKSGPPSPKLKSILAGLTELPKEAAEEAKTIDDLKKLNADLKRQIAVAQRPQPVVQPVAKLSEVEIKKMRAEYQAQINKLTNEFDRRKIAEIKKAVGEMRDGTFKVIEGVAKKYSAASEAPAIPYDNYKTSEFVKAVQAPHRLKEQFKEISEDSGDVKMGAMEKAIFDFLQVRPDITFDLKQVARGSAKTPTSGYSPSGGFRNALGRLVKWGMILRGDGGYKMNPNSAAYTGPDSSRNVRGVFLAHLGKMENEIFLVIHGAHWENKWSVDEIARSCPSVYQPSGGFRNAVGRLVACKLLTRENGKLKLNQTTAGL